MSQPWVSVVVLVLLGVACASPAPPGSAPGSGRGAAHAPAVPSDAVGPRAAEPGASPTRADPEEGLASYYSKALAGRPTASGERYDPGEPTAAHRSLPFGSVVRVERLDADGEATGESVKVRINDRGPFVKGRIIDLSGSAARRLGIEQVGIAPVRVHVLSRP
jgi:rare lipoprotein A